MDRSHQTQQLKPPAHISSLLCSPTPPSPASASPMADDDEAGAAVTSSGSALSFSSSAGEVSAAFRLLVESADRKYARVRDLPPHSRGPLHLLYYRKVFKAYTVLWRFQQEHRRELVAGGLRRWEIGEIASRIGQLYYDQYLRTSEVHYLLEAYVFYEAILNRGYFEAARGSPAPARTKTDLKLGYKELRFYARFLVVALLLNRIDAAKELADRFRALVEQSRTAFPGTSFKEWKQLLNDIVRFLKVDMNFTSARPLRYSTFFDSHPSSVPHIARFHANRILKLRDALLTSYHSNEVKFIELTLDTFRMLQCLEWEPSGILYQIPVKEPSENGVISDQSGASGLIDINLAVDMTDPNLPPNPRKAVLYHPSVPHLIAVLAGICEEMPPESILLIYISASGKGDHGDVSPKYVPGTSKSLLSRAAKSSLDSSSIHPSFSKKPDMFSSSEHYLCLGSRGTGGLNNLYPEDLLPFTRRPLFLIVDSDNSHTFKALHGTERGEVPVLLLSHEKPLAISDNEEASGSQFTYFLTAPLQAFCQLVGLSSEIGADVAKDAESLLSCALAEWEVTLCTSKSLQLVWAQVLPDPFLRRLIVRFIFCRAVLSLLRPPPDGSQRLPECLPSLPESVSPKAAATQTHVFQLAEKLGVANHFQFSDSVKVSAQSR